MRTIHLYADRPANQFVQGFSAGNALTELVVGQHDKLEFIVHNAVKNTAVPAVVPYVEKPLEFTSTRASIGFIDAAPTRGTFRFTVLDQTSAELAWPLDLSTAALIDAWKAECLAALEALTNVGAGEITSGDATDTPANFFYLTWTDPARTDPIGITQKRLLPFTQFAQAGSMTDFGYTQLLKFTQFPVAMTSNFTRPSPPAVTRFESKPGGTGVNAEQTIVIPSAATGSVAFGWSGAETKTMTVQTMTASSLVASLNALVVDGDTNPSFAVEDRPAREGRRLAVRFIGPLAAAAQPLLAVVMSDQEAVPYAVGTLDLAEFPLAVESALNGEREVTLPFELVIVQNGEETFIRDLTILNDMTSAGTEEAVEEAGGVIVRTDTVYIDNSTLEAFATVAPGASFTPPVAVAAGVNQNIAHNFNSLNVRAWVQYQTSLDPAEWRELQRGGEYDWHNATANTSVMNIVYPISDDEEDEFYRERFKVFVSSPDAILEVFGTIETTWAKVRETLPDGQTLAAKLAATDAALGILGGSLRINASQIDGQLSATQMNLASLITALGASGDFLEVIQDLGSDSTLIANIAEGLQSSATFLESLVALATNEVLLAAQAAALLANPTFTSGLRPMIIEILQGTAGTLTDVLLFTLPDWNTTFPAELSPGVFAPLPKMLVSPTDLGTLPGKVVPQPKLGNAGKRYTIGAGGAYLPPDYRKRFVATDVIYSTGLDWFLAAIDGTKYFPAEFDRTLFTIQVNDQMLSENTRFAMLFAFTLSMQGNCKGFYRFRLLRGTANAEVAAVTNLSDITVDETVIDVPIVVTDVATTHVFGYAITRAEDDEEDAPVLSATKQIYTRADIESAAPAAPRFVLIGLLDHFDTQNVAAPAGQLHLTTPASQLASIVKL